MSSHEKSKILLIDDDTSLLVTLSDFLSFEGYEVVTAESGEQGLERLEQMTPDLIILDMSMPGMGGVGFLTKISSADGKPRYPVLVLTARSNMAEFFANVEVDAFVAKPCNPEDLLMEVSRIVFLRKGEKEEESAAAAKREERKVLIGEDDAEALEGIEKAFAREDFVVDSVSKGPGMLEKAIVQQPGVILIKHVLTGMNGDAVARVLKEMPNTKDIPVILYDDGYDPESKYVYAGSGIRMFVRSQEPASLIEAAKKVLPE